jgi:hypothetical protein
VTDTGKEMLPEMIYRIFEPFYTTKDVGKGPGLGFSTVYCVMKQNGGFLDVSSTPEKGSRFTVCLPECMAVADASDHSLSSVHKVPESGDRVLLVVEDEADILQLCAFVLRGEGFTVLTSSSPLEAMEGYIADIIGENGVSGEGLNFLQKPFPIKELIRKVREDP